MVVIGSTLDSLKVLSTSRLALMPILNSSLENEDEAALLERLNSATLEVDAGEDGVGVDVVVDVVALGVELILLFASLDVFICEIVLHQQQHNCCRVLTFTRIHK